MGPREQEAKCCRSGPDGVGPRQDPAPYLSPRIFFEGPPSRVSSRVPKPGFTWPAGHGGHPQESDLTQPVLQEEREEGVVGDMAAVGPCLSRDSG